VAALHAVVSESDEPAVLIAHSGGCITAAVWAAHHGGPVCAALLVTPPHIDGFEPDDASDIPWMVPRSRLPFRAVVVGSRTDPYTTFGQFERFAEDWGAELVDAGDVGHLDTASGFGPWPDGERLVRQLAARSTFDVGEFLGHQPAPDTK
jgi:predicted alpha/beta hydrolase family esterase